MKVWTLSVLCAVLFSSSACTNIKSQRVTDENKDRITAEISTSKDLSDDERQLLIGYMLRHNLPSVLLGGKPSMPTGETIGEMIENQRKWVLQSTQEEKKEKEKQQKLSAEIAAKEVSLRGLVTVTLYNLKEIDLSFLDGFEVGIAFKAGNKDIRAFQGNLELSDILGNSLGEVPVKVFRPLKANNSGTTSYATAYNSFPELRGKHLEDIRTKWKPTKIILADSTELSVPTSAN